MAALMLCYALEIAMLLPAAAFCLIPLWRYVRRPVVVVAVTAAAVLLFAVAGGWLCARCGVTSGEVMLMAAIVGLIALGAWTRAPLSKVLFCFANAAMLCTFCMLYTHFLMGAEVHADADGVFTRDSALACLGLSVALGAVFWRTLRVKLPQLLSERRIDSAWLGLAALPALSALFFRWITPVSSAVVMTGRVRPICLVMLPLFPGFMLTLYHLLWWTAVRMADSARLEQQNHLLQAQSQRCRELREYMDQTRTLRHDFRQHLHVISRFVETGRYDELAAYVRKLEDAAGEAPARYSANPVVDAVLAYYARRAEREGAQADYTVDLPAALPVDENDFCVMLGNLLENALNAVRALPEGERTIRVVSRMRTEAMLGLSVENRYLGELALDGSGLPTSARADHGIGLGSVSAIVSRYRGTMDVRTADGTFSVSILLCL